MIVYKDLFPQGVEDLHSEEYELKENIISYLRDVFRRFGYRQIETPTFEYYDLYSEIDGVLNKDQMFKLIDNNGKILVLRPDVTIPVARIAATNYKTNKEYLKFSYITNVFRLNKSLNGNKREFIQGGIEYLGNKKPNCDAEVIAVGIKTLLGCGLNDFHIDIGQVKFLDSLVSETGLNKFQKIRLYQLIENKNYGDLEELLNNIDVPSEIKNALYKIPKLYGKPERVLVKARNVVINKDMERALNNLENVYSILKDYGFDNCINFDLGFTKQISYYTGIIFKGYVNNFGEVVFSGGRYDNLTGQFGARKAACGMGININKLIEVMGMYDVNMKIDCYTDYLVLYKEKFRERAIKLSESLRERGFIVETDSYDEDTKEHLENASFRNTKEIIEIQEEFIKIINLCKNQVNKYSIAQFFRSLDSEITLSSIH